MGMGIKKIKKGTRHPQKKYKWERNDMENGASYALRQLIACLGSFRSLYVCIELFGTPLVFRAAFNFSSPEPFVFFLCFFGGVSPLPSQAKPGTGGTNKDEGGRGVSGASKNSASTVCDKTRRGMARMG